MGIDLPNRYKVIEIFRNKSTRVSSAYSVTEGTMTRGINARFKANLHALICRSDLSAMINRGANQLMYSASNADKFSVVFYSTR